jgi:alkylhydroperoxidase family enzyme
VKRIANWAIGREERRLGVSLNYLREIAEVSTAALIKLALLTPFASHRQRLPKTAYHLARLTVTRIADCADCLQIAVNLAVTDGVPRNYLRAVLQDHSDELPPALRETCEFARAVAQGWDAPELRETLRSRYGTEGLAELAFAIASAQLFPTLKRALGHTQTCSTHPVAV